MGLQNAQNPARGGVQVFCSCSVPSVPDRCGARALHLGHDLGDEIVLLLLDAGADLEALEGHDARAGALQQLPPVEARGLARRLISYLDRSDFRIPLKSSDRPRAIGTF